MTLVPSVWIYEITNTHPVEKPSPGQDFINMADGDTVVVNGPPGFKVVVKSVNRNCDKAPVHPNQLFKSKQEDFSSGNNTAVIAYDIQGKLRGWGNRLDTDDQWGYFELRNKKLNGPPGGTPPKIPPG